MTDNEKNDLRTGIISIFDKFNILDHTFTIGGLRDNILSFINSIKEESAGSDFETEWENYFRYKGDMATVNIKDLAKHFVEWQKERDKQWLSEEHKHIFAKGRDSMKQQIMDNAVDGAYIKRNKYTKTNVLNGFNRTCEEIQKFRDGDKVKIIIISDIA